MREIKFREWDTIYLEMREVDELRLPIEDVITVYMQYTGLKDKNGVEIYEGDYLRRFDSDGDKDIWLYEVRWQATIASFLIYKHAIPVLGHAAQELWFADNSGLRYEVIGNIYENPYLLK